MAERGKYSPRKLGTILDITHIIIGICVVLMAVFAFLNPARYTFLFPVIFFLAALLNFLTGWFYLQMFPRVRKKKVSGVMYIVVAFITLALCIISTVAILGNA